MFLGKRAIFLLLFIPNVAVLAQPVVETIDIYGPKLVTRHRILSALSLKEGDTLRVGTDSLKKQLLQLNKVKAANVEVVCCMEGKYSLFIGLDAVALPSYLKSYDRDLTLPDTIRQLYSQYMDALRRAVAAGESEDDLSNGHTLMKSEMVRPIQEKFIPVANLYFDQVAAVLLHSSIAEQRAIAASLIAYAGNKAGVVKLYQKALQDPDPGVRNNVLRALTGLAIYSQQHPEARILIPPSVFVSLLHSVEWTDRNKALFCLMVLTETPDKSLCSALKAGALQPLLQMSQWHSKTHAFLAYVVLGRVVGVEDEKIFRSWQEGKHGVVLSAAGKLQQKNKR